MYNALYIFIFFFFAFLTVICKHEEIKMFKKDNKLKKTAKAEIEIELKK